MSVRSRRNKYSTRITGSYQQPKAPCVASEKGIVIPRPLTPFTQKPASELEVSAGNYFIETLVVRCSSTTIGIIRPVFATIDLPHKPTACQLFSFSSAESSLASSVASSVASSAESPLASSVASSAESSLASSVESSAGFFFSGFFSGLLQQNHRWLLQWLLQQNHRWLLQRLLQ